MDLALQLLHLQALQLSGAVGQFRNRQLVFTYEISPTPMSRTYRLQLTFQQGGSPEVRVLSPNIAELGSGHGTIPHLYERAHPVKLCLYLPSTGEWHAGKIIAHTLIPWSAEWLFYFEAWLATGEWSGGGEHPQPKAEKKKKKNNKGIGTKV